MEKNQLNNHFKVILIGGSAGSLDVLMKVLPRLPEKINFALVLILHRKGGGDTILEELIALKTSIPVITVDDKTPMQPGCIYIAPSDYHLLFEKNRLLALDASEKINFSRPSIDVSFESAAESYAHDVIAILLSGANADGTNGLQAVKEHGGLIAVQNPETAEMDYMPRYAIQNLVPDYILEIDGILELLFRFNNY